MMKKRRFANLSKHYQSQNILKDCQCHQPSLVQSVLLIVMTIIQPGTFRLRCYEYIL